jgi:hypothetical protein
MPRAAAPETALPVRSGLSGYLLRHWHGENSLPFAYWVNKVVLGFAWVLLALMLASAAQSMALSSYSVIVVILFAAPVPLTIWMLTGLGATTRLSAHPATPGIGHISSACWW